MQHAVAKRFIHCKQNITIPHTQAFWQKVVTFFENLKSWSHTSLFVWDWIAGENRIASDFTRFYRIAKCVIRRILLDLCLMSRHQQHLDTEKGAEISAPQICDSGGMVGFCARRAQRALFQTHSALTDAVFYTNISSENTPNFSVVLLQIQPTMF